MQLHYPQTADSSTPSHREMIQTLMMAMMGVNRYAYIKENEEDNFTIFAADGTELAEFESFDEARSSILRHNLTHVQLH